MSESDPATPVERAFELARSGSYASVEEIKRQMKREGHPDYYVQGFALSKQLRALIKSARAGGDRSE